MGSQRTRTVSSRRRFSQMPNAKRASMREGPLSQLFRKTAEDTHPGSPAEEPQAVAPVEEPRALPHPSLKPSEDAGAASAEAAPGVGTGEPRQPGVPSPQERLESPVSPHI